MSVEQIKVRDFPLLATLNVLHPQREGPMRDAKEEDVFDALEKMIEKLPLSVSNANASFGNSTESPALLRRLRETVKAIETEVYNSGLGGNKFKNYFAKIVPSTLTLHKSNAQTKIKWVKEIFPMSH